MRCHRCFTDEYIRCRRREERGRLLPLTAASLLLGLEANPTRAQIDRYRREVRAFVEALAAGRLDPGLVGEIEAAFADLGRVVELDFEAVRQEVMGTGLPSPKSRTCLAGKRWPRSGASTNAGRSRESRTCLRRARL